MCTGGCIPIGGSVSVQAADLHTASGGVCQGRAPTEREEGGGRESEREGGREEVTLIHTAPGRCV